MYRLRVNIQLGTDSFSGLTVHPDDPVYPSILRHIRGAYGPDDRHVLTDDGANILYYLGSQVERNPLFGPEHEPTFRSIHFSDNGTINMIRSAMGQHDYERGAFTRVGPH